MNKGDLSYGYENAVCCHDYRDKKLPLAAVEKTSPKMKDLVRRQDKHRLLMQDFLALHL